MAAGSDAVAGWLHLFTSPAIARARFEHAIDTAARLHFPQVIGTSYLGLAMVTALEDERARAARFFGEALDHWEQIGDRPQTWSALRWVGFWLARWGRPSAAARLLAAVEARPDAPVLTDLEKALFDEVDASLREELEEVDEARAEGSVWSRRHALRAARRELSKVVQDVEQSSAIESAEPRDTERDASGGRSIFRRDGELWALSFDGRSALIRDLKGLHDIALLLSQPEREVHCLDLADRTESGSSDAPVLDARARREYEKRIQDLQDDLAEAEAHNDYGRAEKAGAELDALTEQLAAAFGLGGRERGLGSSVERARSAVTWRIRSAIKKIEGVHEPLGKHLRASIQTGVYVAYSPPAPVDWEL
jgi:hypothetical protein